MTQKRCCRCKQYKLFSSFSSNKSTKDGYGFYCKPCDKESRRQRKARRASKEEAVAFRQDLEDRGILFQCTKCKEKKTALNFSYRRNTEKPTLNTSVCKTCNNDRLRIRKFGVDPITYFSMLDKQDEKCAICRIDYEDAHERYGKIFAVDHCHSTGKVRALLCVKCNNGLGAFEDNPDWMRLAAEYVEKEGDIV